MPRKSNVIAFLEDRQLLVTMLAKYKFISEAKCGRAHACMTSLLREVTKRKPRQKEVQSGLNFWRQNECDLRKEILQNNFGQTVVVSTGEISTRSVAEGLLNFWTNFPDETPSHAELTHYICGPIFSSCVNANNLRRIRYLIQNKMKLIERHLEELTTTTTNEDVVKKAARKLSVLFPPQQLIHGYPEEDYRPSNLFSDIPSSFTIALKYSDVFEPEDCASVTKDCHNNVYEQFVRTNFACVLKFEHTYPKKSSHTATRIVACCKFSTCTARYRFVATSESVDGGVVFDVSQHGEIRHLSDEIQRRCLSNSVRKSCGVVMNPYTQYFAASNDKKLDQQRAAGNLTLFPKAHTLRQAKFEHSKKKQLHEDAFLELAELEKKEEPAGKYIRKLCKIPLGVVLFKSGVVDILVDMMRTDAFVGLYVDGTGGTVQQLHPLSSSVFYHSAVIKTACGPLSVSDFLTNSQDVESLTFWLQNFARALADRTERIFTKVETDYCLTLIQAVCLAINKVEVEVYLRESFWLETGKLTKSDVKPRSVIHICSAHLSHAVSGKLKSLSDNAAVRNFCLLAFTRMQETESLNELDVVFTEICTVLLSKGDNDDLKTCYHILGRRFEKLDTDSNDAGIGARTFPEHQQQQHEFKSILRNKFYFRFLSIVEKLVVEVGGGTLVTNDFYLPKFVDYLMDSYMGIAPLWTAFNKIHPERKRDTNDIIESWYGIVKHRILPNHKNQGIGRFVESLSEIIQTECNEYTTLVDCTTRKRRLVPMKRPAKWKKRGPNRQTTIFDSNSSSAQT